jgi:hypothetical protein
MCISEEVSLATFIICTLSCIYLFKRNNKNDKWIAILFIYLGSMQFLEYLMWKDQECKGLNQLATNIGFIHNILQPLVSLLIAYYFTGGKIHPCIYLIFGLYLMTSLPKIIKKKEKNQCSLPCNNGVDGLSWKYTTTEYPIYVWAVFCLALIAPLLSMSGGGKIYAGIVLAIYFLAHCISISRCPNNIGAPPNGSWWCMMAAFIPLLSIKINK